MQKLLLFCQNKNVLIFLGLLLLLLFLSTFFQSNPGVVDPMVGRKNWNTASQRETSLGTYLVWNSADFKGGDLGFQSSRTIDECLFTCDETKDCLYISYSNKVCYLKSSPSGFEQFKNRPSLFAAKRVISKPFVSETWHEAQLLETAEARYKTWDHSEWKGDILTQTVVSNIDACAKACDLEPACLYFNFNLQKCSFIKDSQNLEKTRTVGSRAAIKVRTKSPPDALVKHNWAKGESVETDYAFYQTWQGGIFEGATITTVKSDSLKDCLKECDNELFCHHITLIGQECSLKGWNPDYFEIITEQRNDKVWSAKQLSIKQKQQTHRAENTGLAVTDKNGCQDLHKDFLVGELYDEAENRQTQYNRYRVWEGYEFLGGELHPKSIRLETYTLDNCLKECDHIPECGFVVVEEGKECWLQSQPYYLSRVIDARSGIYSAMKLGRTHRKGLDCQTTYKFDRRGGIESILSSLSSFTRHFFGFIFYLTKFFLIWGIVGIIVLLGFNYWKGLSNRSYINEL
eukprot:c22313_g1_i1.p1 GENE.c22313_g1_i1~~c22313_g1_i1.p1  ORF type:complete len:532 (-),score=216.81 c22313_g1_i1:4-1551(-)